MCAKRAICFARVRGLEEVEYIFEELCSEKIRNLYRSRREKVLSRARIELEPSFPSLPPNP